MIRRKIKWGVVLAGAAPIAFFIEQNNYFGWNSRPQSQAELIADGINILIIVLSLIYIHLASEYEPTS